MFMLWSDLLSWGLPLGLGIGLVLGLTGAGGAILATPLLMLLFHLNIQAASPIALLAVCLASCVGALLGLRQGIVRYRAAMLMSVVGAVMAPVGVAVAGRVPSTPLTLLFMLVLLWVAKRAFTLPQAKRDAASVPTTPPHPCQLSEADGRFIWNARCAWILASVGGVAGGLGGLLGVGGGFVIVPAMQQLTNAPMKTIVATSLMVIALSSLSGVVAVVSTGKLNWHIGLPFALGVTVGLLISRPIAHHTPAARLQQIFGIMVVIVFFIMGSRLM